MLEVRGDIQVVDTYSVKVQSLAGDAFNVKLDTSRNSVAVLKTEIEKAEGTKELCQQLFVAEREGFTTEARGVST